VLIALAGCSFSGGTAAPDATYHSPQQRDLDVVLAEAQVSQAAALALWDRVIFGEVVSCQESIPVPEPVQRSGQDSQSYPNPGAVEDRLNAAIQLLHNSADLWNIECNDDRPFVPLSMAREGRAAALAASGPLSEAAALMNEP